MLTKVEIHCGIKKYPLEHYYGNCKDIKHCANNQNPIHLNKKTADAGRPTGENQCSENVSLHPGINKKLC